MFASLLFMDTCANLTCPFVRRNFLPPFLPLALAEVKPARVRSRMSSRSNSAKAANIPNISLPEAVLVSILAPCPVITLKPT